MSTYQYTNPEQSWIFSSNGRHFPVDEGNLDYKSFLESGAIAAPYVLPEPPAEPTLTEKLKSLGIDPAELKATLEAV
jgi:hypothetical protein